MCFLVFTSSPFTRSLPSSSASSILSCNCCHFSTPTFTYFCPHSWLFSHSTQSINRHFALILIRFPNICISIPISHFSSNFLKSPPFCGISTIAITTTTVAASSTFLQISVSIILQFTHQPSFHCPLTSRHTRWSLFFITCSCFGSMTLSFFHFFCIIHLVTHYQP